MEIILKFVRYNKLAIIFVAAHIFLCIIASLLQATSIYWCFIILVFQISLIFAGAIYFRKPFKRWTLKYNAGLKWFSSIYPGAAAVWLLFFKDNVYANTKTFFKLWNDGSIKREFLIALGSSDMPSLREFYTLDVWTVYYVIILLIWLSVYFFFVVNESQKNEERNKKIESTILRAPNPDVFSKYNEISEGLYTDYVLLRDCKTKQQYEFCFRKILPKICKITRQFVGSNEDVSYGANIMLYIPADIGYDKIEYLRSKNFYHFTDKKTEQFNGVLRLERSLLFTEDIIDNNGLNISKKKSRDIPLITMPILKGKIGMNSDQIKKYNLPGAPVAAISGEFIFHDVLEEYNYDSLNVFEKQECLRYWRESAPDVKSVISIRIPHNWRDFPNRLNIIGVLNVDCSKINPLGGRDREFHLTFFSLINPILCQISFYLSDYYDLCIRELEAEMSCNQ
jgi:hypothetical protein